MPPSNKRPFLQPRPYVGCYFMFSAMSGLKMIRKMLLAIMAAKAFNVHVHVLHIICSLGYGAETLKYPFILVSTGL